MDFTRTSQIDMHDAAFVAERTKRPILWSIPAPIVDGKINPHVSRFYLGRTKKGEEEYTDLFHVKPVYYETIHGAWRPMSEVASYYGNHRIDLKEDWADKMNLRYLSWLLKRMELIGGRISIPSPLKIGQLVPLSEYPKDNHALINFLTLTAYPDPNPETTTVDGWVLGQASGSSWLNSRNHAGGGTNSSFDDSSASSGERFLYEDRGNSSADYNTRSMFLFDTSSLTAPASISAATFSVWIINKAIGGDMGNGYVVPSFPASNTGMALGDYDGFTINSSPKFGDITSASVTNNQYYDITINSTGRADINKTGVTKWGTRSARDVDSGGVTDYTGSEVGQSGYFADQTGTTNDPKLVVTYTTSTAYTSTLTDAVTVVDTVLKTSGRTLTDTVSLADSILRQATKTLSDSVSLVDSVLKNTTMRVLTEAVALVDTVISLKVQNVTLTDAVALVDSIVRTVSRTLSDTVTAVDTFTRQVVLARVYEETVTVVDTVLRVPTKVLGDAIALTDTIERRTTKVLSDAVTLVDTVIRRTERTLADAVTVVDTFTSAVFKAAVLTETVTLVSHFIASFLNYVRRIPFIGGQRRSTGSHEGARGEGGSPGTRYE